MLTGKKVLVIGLARSGKAAVELLDKLHATITVNEYATQDKIDCYDEYGNIGQGGTSREAINKLSHWIERYSKKKDFGVPISPNGFAGLL